MGIKSSEQLLKHYLVFMVKQNYIIIFITFSTNMVLDKKFEEIYPTDEKRVQLSNNGKTALNIRIGLHSCVLGIRSYSSVLHRIRISIDKGIAMLDIRSRSISSIPDENWLGIVNENTQEQDKITVDITCAPFP